MWEREWRRPALAACANDDRREAASCRQQKSCKPRPRWQWRLIKDPIWRNYKPNSGGGCVGVVTSGESGAGSSGDEEKHGWINQAA